MPAGGGGGGLFFGKIVSFKPVACKRMGAFVGVFEDFA